MTVDYEKDLFDDKGRPIKVAADCEEDVSTALFDSKGRPVKVGGD
jgi:hypothetical protein